MTQTETDLKKWQQQQLRFQKIFGNEAILDKSFQKVKLKELEKIYRKNKRTSDPVEKATLHWLKAGNKSMERLLYPRFRQRLFRRMLLVVRRIMIRRQEPRKARTVSASPHPVARNWVDQHVNNPMQKPAGRQSQVKASRQQLSKSPRIRVPESDGKAIRMSR